MILVIGRKETVLGFGLVGVNEIIEINESISKKELEEKINKIDPTLVIVDEYTMDKYGEIIEKLKQRAVIIEIPSYNYKGKGKERFKKLIKEAFGIELNIV